GRKNKPPVKRDKAYRGKILPLYIEDSREWAGLAIGLAASIMVMVGFISSTLLFHKKKPQSFAELHPRYIAKFYYPEHIRTAPEAIQEYLDRSNYLRSVYDYYTSLTQMLMGWEPWGRPRMYDTSIAIYKDSLYEQQEKI